eukprot:TRINITY_DN557_c3_g1_i2.p1 TRINITY_DN557_c3_g1~~TRINITY_DN557_c3_g1_i2.p1  ORF type:complete len:349 (-),score=80.02 TRINITY_DN557_c3_g1_i2:215-1261(-)
MKGNNNNNNNGIQVSSPPNDSISGLSWSPRANHLACSSWDGEVRVWDIDGQGRSNPIKLETYTVPVLSLCWNTDGNQIYSGNCANKVMALDLQTGNSIQVGEHAAPVRCIKMYHDQRVLITGSWDRTVRYWDLRQPNPAATIQIGGKVFAMDCKADVLAVGHESGVNAYQVSNPTVIGKQWDMSGTDTQNANSHIQYQIRALGIFNDGKGVAVSSIAGRVACVYIAQQKPSLDFSFKCHRKQSEVYPINSVTFHPQFASFATAGSDGSFFFWDKDNRRVLKKAENVSQNPIICSEFNATGQIYAYATGYDWSKGVEFYEQNPQLKTNAIFMYPVQTPEDVKPRPGNQG